MEQTEVFGNSQPEQNPFSRRGFFKAGSAFGAAVCAQAVLENANAAPQQPGRSLISQRRSLGAGSAVMEVSALGFGCMGLNYHRGVHPGREAMIKLVRQAAERGVQFLDTAASFAPPT